MSYNSVELKGGNLMYALQQFNENFKKIPFSADELIQYAERYFNGENQVYAIKVLKALKSSSFHSNCIMVSPDNQISFKRFEIRFVYNDCKIASGDLDKLYNFIDQLFEKINEISPNIQLYRIGEGTGDAVQVSVPITWTI